MGMYGWAGRILRVDLTRSEISIIPTDESVVKQFLGGRGLNSWTLFNEITPGIDPLGPENVICFSPGIFTGTKLRLTGRISVSTLSPLSGILGDGSGGGAFASEVKAAGYDQIVITGKADRPVYLRISDNDVEILDAGDLTGLSTWEKTDIIRENEGKRVSVVCIGLAGENLVRFATVIIDRYSSTTRGSGAVMGSKNLMAVAVSGTGKIPVADPLLFKKLSDEDKEYFRNNSFFNEQVKVYGSHFGIVNWHPGVRNSSYYLTPEEVPESIRPEKLKSYETGRTACKTCTVGCKNVFEIPSGKYAGEKGEGLEFEAVYCLGTNCGIFDPVAILEMENLCDKYGMCVVGLGNAIAFAKDLFSRGIISEEDTGLSLSWEDSGSQTELIHRTALREGFGNTVAEGMYSMAKILGRNSMDYCYHVKGLCRGVYPPGVFSLAHATSTRGADHLRGRSWALDENEPEFFRELVNNGFMPKDPAGALTVAEKAATFADCTGRCKGSVNSWSFAVPLVFKSPLFKGSAELLSAATGLYFSEREVTDALEKIYLTEMAFNARQGVKRGDDRLVQHPWVRDSKTGREEIRIHDEMLDRYYTEHGCDLKTGIPTGKRLLELGAASVADELERGMPYPDWDGPVLWERSSYPSGGKRM
ncbi:aldehyde ferredoxin oxidoreductase family protein [Methanoplanus endosymbiosus]|uniref:Aldehyde ferredoxin oxidoreductase n=1 Tax=Methanoplanus endosymbiosus TaxID=33865 RepID=A0A9E7PNL3_9EURY|nr:aldehyde ferredoxin oxidoreductase C-terminal domain-containing protein [Methanoplanus endosymbiosus]UUX92627.1 aldehyde ferredoxin oxidoreductase [Methanoplanus endosymbiosus]